MLKTRENPNPTDVQPEGLFTLANGFVKVVWHDYHDPEDPERVTHQYTLVAPRPKLKHYRQAVEEGAAYEGRSIEMAQESADMRVRAEQIARRAAEGDLGEDEEAQLRGEVATIRQRQHQLSAESRTMGADFTVKWLCALAHVDATTLEWPAWIADSALPGVLLNHWRERPSRPGAGPKQDRPAPVSTEDLQAEADQQAAEPPVKPVAPVFQQPTGPLPEPQDAPTEPQAAQPGELMEQAPPMIDAPSATSQDHGGTTSPPSTGPADGSE